MPLSRFFTSDISSFSLWNANNSSCMPSYEEVETNFNPINILPWIDDFNKMFMVYNTPWKIVCRMPLASHLHKIIRLINHIVSTLRTAFSPYLTECSSSSLTLFLSVPNSPFKLQSLPLSSTFATNISYLCESLYENIFRFWVVMLLYVYVGYTYTCSNILIIYVNKHQRYNTAFTIPRS